MRLGEAENPGGVLPGPAVTLGQALVLPGHGLMGTTCG